MTRTNELFPIFSTNSSTIMSNLSTGDSEIQLNNLYRNNTILNILRSMTPKILFNFHSIMVPSSFIVLFNKSNKHNLLKFKTNETCYNSQEIGRIVSRSKHEKYWNIANYCLRWNNLKEKNTLCITNCTIDLNDAKSKKNLLKLPQDDVWNKIIGNKNSRHSCENYLMISEKNCRIWRNSIRFLNSKNVNYSRYLYNLTNDAYWNRKTRNIDQYGPSLSCTNEGNMLTQKKIYIKNPTFIFKAWYCQFGRFAKALVNKENSDIMDCHNVITFLKFVTNAIGYKRGNNKTLLTRQKFNVSLVPYQSTILRNLCMTVHKKTRQKKTLIHMHSYINKTKFEISRKLTDRFYSTPVIFRCDVVNTVEFCRKIPRIQKFHYFGDREILGKRSSTSTYLILYANFSYTLFNSKSYQKKSISTNASEKLASIFSKLRKHVPSMFQLKKNINMCSTQINAKSTIVREPYNYPDTRFSTQYTNLYKIPKLNSYMIYKIHINDCMYSPSILILLLDGTLPEFTGSNTTTQRLNIKSNLFKIRFEKVHMTSELKTATFIKVPGMSTNVSSILIPVSIFFDLRLHASVNLAKINGLLSALNFSFYKKNDSLTFSDSNETSKLFMQENLLFLRKEKQNLNFTNPNINTSQHFDNDFDDGYNTTFEKKKKKKFTTIYD